MGRKTINHLGPIPVTERAFSFEKEDGYFYKTVHTLEKDLKTGEVLSKSTDKCEEKYIQTLDESFDDFMEFEDLDGTMQKIRFKKVEEDLSSKD